ARRQIRLTDEHNPSNTGDPLSTGPLASVGSDEPCHVVWTFRSAAAVYHDDSMLQVLFHTWERRLAAATTNRVVRPFEWGLEWIPANGSSGLPPADQLRQWTAHVMSDTDAFFSAPPTTDYTLGPPAADGERLLPFPTAVG